MAKTLRLALMEGPSGRIMRAAGRAASTEAIRNQGAKAAKKRMDALMRKIGQGNVATAIGSQT